MTNLSIRFIKRTIIEAIAKILNVNKPVGITSYDVVRRVKRFLDFKKIGHGGTLDPFADGVLLILIGRGATKQMDELLKMGKTYRAVLQMGEKTDTADTEGEIIAKANIPAIDDDILDKIREEFIGEYLQTPPQYSAKKVNGKPAYKYARKGIKVELKAKKVNIYELTIEKINDNQLEFVVTCSSGTYVRVLGEEIAEKLGTVGHLVKLTRESIGQYNLENAVDLDAISEALGEEKKFLQAEVEIN